MTPCCLVLALLVPPPLAPGRPAPPLDLVATLRGEAVAGLPQGKLCVVEFSGTLCDPCVRCIPLLNAMQAEHKDALFVSVFVQDEKAVRDYLAGFGKDIGIRVALGGKAAWPRWMDAARVSGIPTTFVVGTDGKIAWIGSPFDLAGPLRKIAAGTYDPVLDAVKLRFRQIDNVESRSAMRRLDENNKLLRKIYNLLSDQRWSEAEALAERGACDYPEVATRYRTLAVQSLAAKPETTMKAIDKAATLSSSLQWSWADGNPKFGAFQAQIAQALLDGYRTNPDPRLLLVADLLVQRSEAFLESSKERYPDHKVPGMKWYVAKTAVNVAVARKDFATAATRQREVIALSGNPQYEEGKYTETREAFDKRMREYAAERLAKLAEYEAAAKPK